MALSKKTKLIIGGLVLLAIGGVVWYKRSFSTSSSGKSSGSSAPKKESVTKRKDTVSTVKVTKRNNPKASWITNTNVANFLSTKLDDSQLDKLKGWVSLIQVERGKDSTKFTESKDLKGQNSDISHGLFQMNLWNNEVATGMKDAQNLK